MEFPVNVLKSKKYVCTSMSGLHRSLSIWCKGTKFPPCRFSKLSDKSFHVSSLDLIFIVQLYLFPTCDMGFDARPKKPCVRSQPQVGHVPQNAPRSRGARHLQILKSFSLFFLSLKILNFYSELKSFGQKLTFLSQSMTFREL